MIELHLTRGDNQEGVRLRFPTTPAEIGEAFALLDTVSRYAGDVRILDVKSPVANIGQYVRYADLNSREDMQKLNTLAESVSGISSPERWMPKASTGWMMCFVSQSRWRNIPSSPM